MRAALTFILVAALSPAAPFARQEPSAPPQQPPPAENPLPQQSPEVEDTSQPPAPPPPPAPAPPAPVTLGEMVTRAAAGLKLPAPAAGQTPESAAWALVQKGIRVRPELASPLTEADVVGLLAGLGFKVRTTTPSRVVSRDRFEILAEAFFTAPAPARAPAPAPVPAPATPPSEGRH